MTIAQIEGRVRGAGSEFVLACDMRFAARETAIFCQPEQGFGLIPGAGGIQHLTRLMGRARALEVMLSADDYDAELAERYGWINRALPAETLPEFVRSLAHRIAGCPATAARRSKIVSTRSRSRQPTIFVATRISSWSARATRTRSAESARVLTRGFQTHDGEITLATIIGDLPDQRNPGVHHTACVTWNVSRHVPQQTRPAIRSGGSRR